MSPLVSNVNLTLSILTVIAQVAIVLLLFAMAFPTGRDWLHSSKRSVEAKLRHGDWPMKIAFLVALVATLGSLFYSDVAGFEPCKLCWYQRILMYPQVILFGLALWKRDHGVWLYSLTLSVIGAAIAGYHYLLQLGIAPSLPCSAVGYSASCAQRFVMTFGYITIPVMALTAFVLLALLALTMRRQSR